MFLSTKFKFKFLHRAVRNKEFKLLDVGSGNRSAHATKKHFPKCKYYGLDLNKDYNYSENDFKLMEDFYELDLTKLDYSSIPDNYFDYIQMAHVIEHLYNGDEVVKGLLTKLKPGGYFYVEYPGEKSTRLPSMPGVLNFYDDSTHVRVFSVPELKKLFEGEHCKVLKGGTRRNIWYIILFPAFAIQSYIKRGVLWGVHLWDILGFAEFLWVKKLH